MTALTAAPPRPGASAPAYEVATLIGARGPTIVWARAGVFAAALLASSLIWVVIQPLASGTGLPPARVFLNVLFYNAVTAGSAVAAFRLIRNDLAAAAAAALLYSVIMFPLRLLLQRLPEGMPDYWLVMTRIAVSGLLGVFFTLAGLWLGLKLIRHLGLALLAGALIGSLAQQLVSPLIQSLIFPSTSFAFRLGDLAWGTGEALILAAVLYGAHAAGWLPAPSTGGPIALPLASGPQRMPSRFYVGIPAVCFGIAIPLVLAGNLLALSEPRTALPLLGVALLPLLIGSIVMMMFFYHIWAAIQDGHARTTPGKAIGLLFVPFFNFYWAFQVLPGFATDYNALIRRHGLALPPLPSGLFLAYLALSFASAIPVAGLVALLINYFIAMAMLSRATAAVNALPTTIGR